MAKPAAQAYLTFGTLPPHTAAWTVCPAAQFELSGIQKFIFGGTDMASTPARILRRSRYVQELTAALRRWLEEQLPGGLWVENSGKLIAILPASADTAALEAAAGQAQRRVWSVTAGLLSLDWGWVYTRLQPAGQAPPAPRGLEKLFQKEQPALPPFAAAVARRITRCKFHAEVLLGAAAQAAAEDGWRMELLTPAQPEHSTAAGAGADSRMAIKFDLDNLGMFFPRLAAFDEREAASRALARVMDGAFAGLAGVQRIFIGGDDIFAIAPLESALQLVAAMAANLRRGVDTVPEMAPYRPHFSLCGGVDYIRRSTEPLLYYFLSSEQQLEKAKDIPGKNRVCWMGTVLTWPQLNTLAAVVGRCGERLFAGCTDQQRSQALRDVSLLRRRILTMDRAAGLLTEQEKQIVEEIGSRQQPAAGPGGAV